MEGGISGKLITLGYLIFSLGLILSPFFVIRKFKTIKWRHIFLGYFLSAGIFVGIFYFDIWFDRYLYKNVYNSGWIMDALLHGLRNECLILTFIFIISPFLITRLKYKKINKKRGWLSLLVSLIFLAIAVTIWIYIIMLGARTFINFG